MRKHKKIGFYILTLISAVFFGGISTFLFDVNNITHYALSLSMVQMSPLCGLLLLCLINKDFRCFKEMNLFSNISFKWILLSIGLPVIIISSSSIILSKYGYPYIPNDYSPLSLTLVIFTSTIGCIGEELGWRGFLLPEFHKKYSLMSSSLFTGILWGAWHFGKISLYGLLGYLLFVIMIVEFSVLMAFIFKKTNKNMLLMILFHLMINISSIIMLSTREGLAFYIIACVIGAVLCTITIISNKETFLVKS